VVGRALPVLLGLAVAAFAGTTVSATAGGGLVWRSSKAAAFRIRVPADWRYRNATYPSDHSTEYWTSPTDRRARLKVEVSGCVGCVEPSSCVLKGTGCRPAPENILPAGVLSRTKLDRWRVRYVARTTGTQYLDRGLIAIVHAGGEIRGFALVQVWVPGAQASVAAAMLASFSVR
jgi:hypothetical protein